MKGKDIPTSFPPLQNALWNKFLKSFLIYLFGMTKFRHLLLISGPTENITNVSTLINDTNIHDEYKTISF